ncbi:MAG TPA: polysaccharide biosynthesis protein, partial [Thermosynergistes sp.]|nr:polysaccharide biosynthesis protein [Thermosynergistes sp.]
MEEKRNAGSGFVAKFTVDVVLSLAASVLAIWLRLGSGWTHTRFAPPLMIYIIVAMAAKAIIYTYMGYSYQSWRSVGLRDAISLGKGMVIFVILMSGAFFFLGVKLRIPRSIPINDGALTLILTAGARAIVRLYFEDMRSRKGKKPQKRTLIVGAGEAGTLIARELLRHPETDMRPVGFLDDDPSKRRQSFLGLPVFGNIDSLAEVVQKQRIQQILIAMPSAHGSVVRKVVRYAKEAEITPQIVPGIYEVLSGEVEVSQIRNVDVEDLLRRDPVRLDSKSIAAYLEGKTILVTGAGGSIGSEIVNQVMKFEPQMLILLGRGENSIFEAMHRLKLYAPKWAGRVATVIADVRDSARLERIFAEHRPQVVFHAAAHKHVPLMEDNPDEAIFNNVGGTLNLAELALRFEVERFVNLSTDKAVNPASIMGASKRV